MKAPGGLLTTGRQCLKCAGMGLSVLVTLNLTCIGAGGANGAGQGANGQQQHQHSQPVPISGGNAKAAAYKMLNGNAAAFHPSTGTPNGRPVADSPTGPGMQGAAQQKNGVISYRNAAGQPSQPLDKIRAESLLLTFDSTHVHLACLRFGRGCSSATSWAEHSASMQNVSLMMQCRMAPYACRTARQSCPDATCGLRCSGGKQRSCGRIIASSARHRVPCGAPAACALAHEPAPSAAATAPGASPKGDG